MKQLQSLGFGPLRKIRTAKACRDKQLLNRPIVESAILTNIEHGQVKPKCLHHSH